MSPNIEESRLLVLVGEQAPVDDVRQRLELSLRHFAVLSEFLPDLAFDPVSNVGDLLLAGLLDGVEAREGADLPDQFFFVSHHPLYPRDLRED